MILQQTYIIDIGLNGTLIRDNEQEGLQEMAKVPIGERAIPIFSMTKR